MQQAIETRVMPFSALPPLSGGKVAGVGVGTDGPTDRLPGTLIFPRGLSGDVADTGASGAAAFGSTSIGEAARRALTESKLQQSPDAALADLSTAESRGADGLTEEERRLLDTLEARDREVRDHEEAHARVGGPYAGEPSYTYQRGPDGGRYAIGGAVAIDVSPVEGDPAATIDKMTVVKAAALAPAEPSAADRSIAALADAQARAAQAELNAQRTAALTGATEPSETTELAVSLSAVGNLPAALVALAPSIATEQLNRRV